MTVTVLMVAEKPSICTAIASALSRGQMESRGRTPPVHEFQGNFQGKSALFRVTSVVGHIFSMDFPSSYQNWDATNPIDLFDAPVVSIPESKGGIIKHLEREATGVDYLVLWLDCDREGENICFEVIRCTQKSMKRVNGQQIFRAKFSAVTAKDIDIAMRNLGSPNENESKAVEARQEMDLKIGVAFSRFQTKYFQGKYGDLDSAVISYGPCQTPTLGFCVERHDEIKCFIPEPFWSIDVSVDINGRTFPLEWKRKRLFDEEVASTLLQTLKDRNRNDWYDLYVTSITRSESRRVRPTAMNTVTLLKLASSSLGIGPQAAMRAAEHLYLSGYLSYPRTESTAYPSSFDVRGTLSIVTSHPFLGEYANELLRDGYNNAKAGVDVGDHPPITPVGMPNLNSLSSDEVRIFDLVVQHFLASISRDAKFLITKATFSSTPPSLLSSNNNNNKSNNKSNNNSNNNNNQQQQQNDDQRLCVEEFVIIGREEIEPGFTRVYGRSRYQDNDNNEDNENDDTYGVEQTLPSQISVGLRCRITLASLRKGMTTVPKYLTESELIGKMEKNGIGTDASIPTHINNIIVRNYVTLGPGRTLIPTGLGVVLVHGYYRIDPDLVYPDVRATIEKFCDMIAKGIATKEDVVNHSLRNFKNKFSFFSENIGAMDTLFEASFSPLAATGKFLSKCGKCLRYMRYIPLKPQRLYCPHCEETYSLPQNGTIKLYKEIRCPLDNFELVLFSLGNAANAQGKSYPLCPCCYNHPPNFQDLLLTDQNDNNNVNSKIEGKDEDDNDENEDNDIEDGDGDGNEDFDDDDDDNKKISANEDNDEGNQENNIKKKEVTKSKSKQLIQKILSKMGCNQCRHPTCKQSLEFTGICPCPNQINPTSEGGNQKGKSSNSTISCPGTLVLDTNSKPNWKLACNECNTLVRFHANIHNITVVSRQHCEECSTKLLHFEFNKLQKSPLANGEDNCTACIICDDTLNSLTEIISGRTIHLNVLKQMRAKRSAGGRGRGRGGRGRGGRGGRGGGGKKGDVKMSFSDF